MPGCWRIVVELWRRGQLIHRWAIVDADTEDQARQKAELLLDGKAVSATFLHGRGPWHWRKP